MAKNAPRGGGSWAEQLGGATGRTTPDERHFGAPAGGEKGDLRSGKSAGGAKAETKIVSPKESAPEVAKPAAPEEAPAKKKIPREMWDGAFAARPDEDEDTQKMRIQQMARSMGIKTNETRLKNLTQAIYSRGRHLSAEELAVQYPNVRIPGISAEHSEAPIPEFAHPAAVEASAPAPVAPAAEREKKRMTEEEAQAIVDQSFDYKTWEGTKKRLKRLKEIWQRGGMTGPFNELQLQDAMKRGLMEGEVDAKAVTPKKAEVFPEPAKRVEKPSRATDLRNHLDNADNLGINPRNWLAMLNELRGLYSAHDLEGRQKLANIDLKYGSRERRAQQAVDYMLLEHAPSAPQFPKLPEHTDIRGLQRVLASDKASKGDKLYAYNSLAKRYEQLAQETVPDEEKQKRLDLAGVYRTEARKLSGLGTSKKTVPQQEKSNKDLAREWKLADEQDRKLQHERWEAAGNAAGNAVDPLTVAPKTKKEEVAREQNYNLGKAMLAAQNREQMSKLEEYRGRFVPGAREVRPAQPVQSQEVAAAKSDTAEQKAKKLQERYRLIPEELKGTPKQLDEAIRQSIKELEIKAVKMGIQTADINRLAKGKSRDERFDILKQAVFGLTRDAAEATLARIPNYTEEHPLHAPNEAEGNEKFKKITREVWREFVVHGIAIPDRVTGKIKVIPAADLDGRGVAGLLYRAGIDISNVQYTASGQAVPGKINIDTGNRDGFIVEDGGNTVYIDHHTAESGNDNSASKVAYEVLTRLGLLEASPALDKVVKFITQHDNLSFPAEELGKKSARTLVGLRKELSFAQLETFFQNNQDPYAELSENQLRANSIGKGKTLWDASENRRKALEQAEIRLQEMEQQGLLIDSKDYGKIIIDLDNSLPTGGDAAKASGAGMYLKWVPKTNSFFLSSFNTTLKHKFSQGIPVRDTMWIKPMTDEKPLTLKLNDVLNELTSGEFKPTGELEKYLQTPEAEGASNESQAEQKERELRQMAEEVFDESAQEEFLRIGMKPEEIEYHINGPFHKRKREEAIKELMDENRSQF